MKLETFGRCCFWQFRQCEVSAAALKSMKWSADNRFQTLPVEVNGSINTSEN